MRKPPILKLSSFTSYLLTDLANTLQVNRGFLIEVVFDVCRPLEAAKSKRPLKTTVVVSDEFCQLVNDYASKQGARAEDAISACFDKMQSDEKLKAEIVQRVKKLKTYFNSGHRPLSLSNYQKEILAEISRRTNLNPNEALTNALFMYLDYI
jgi:hypothetical protein